MPDQSASPCVRGAGEHLLPLSSPRSLLTHKACCSTFLFVFSPALGSSKNVVYTHVESLLFFKSIWLFLLQNLIPNTEEPLWLVSATCHKVFDTISLSPGHDKKDYSSIPLKTKKPLPRHLKAGTNWWMERKDRHRGMAFGRRYDLTIKLSDGHMLRQSWWMHLYQSCLWKVMFLGHQ